MKIGIITMHRVQNYGSALQAYALQQKLSQNGYDSTIIDYHYFYLGYNPSLLQFVIDKTKRLLKALLRHPVSHTRFVLFQWRYMKLTWREYTKNGLVKNPPQFDVYMTGSDQVWNAKFTLGDTNFLLKFAPAGAPRCSYASSFACNSVPEKYQDDFKTELSKYQSILVRERSGVDIVKSLTGKEAKVVCDPTLLLKDLDYKPLATKSKIKRNAPYILVYILDYMYDPFPDIYQIIRKVKAILGLKVVYMGIGKNKIDPEDNDCDIIKDAGPLEFLWLIENASFVITTSFHGTAFATIFHKPLFSVVNNVEAHDGRMQTLLLSIHQSDSIIAFNEIPSEELIKSNKIVSKEEYVQNLRDNSTHALLESLKNIKR